jgi:hypothetical protein
MAGIQEVVVFSGNHSAWYFQDRRRLRKDPSVADGGQRLRRNGRRPSPWKTCPREPLNQRFVNLNLKNDEALQGSRETEVNEDFEAR